MGPFVWPPVGCSGIPKYEWRNDDEPWEFRCTLFSDKQQPHHQIISVKKPCFLPLRLESPPISQDKAIQIWRFLKMGVPPNHSVVMNDETYGDDWGSHILRSPHLSDVHIHHWCASVPLLSVPCHPQPETSPSASFCGNAGTKTSPTAAAMAFVPPQAWERGNRREIEWTSGWWWLEHGWIIFIYFSIYWESSSQLTKSIIFQRGFSTCWNHQPDIDWMWTWGIDTTLHGQIRG